jgi:hypothetical protein
LGNDGQIVGQHIKVFLFEQFERRITGAFFEPGQRLEHVWIIDRVAQQPLFAPPFLLGATF